MTPNSNSPADTPSDKTMPKGTRFWLTSLLGFLGLLITLPLLAWLALQWDLVQYKLIQGIESALSQKESKVHIRGLEGVFPIEMRLAGLQLRDTKGVWLEIEQGVAILSFKNLLKGEIHVKTLTAQRMTLLRQPIQEVSTLSPPDSWSLPSLLFWPQITLDTLQIAHLELGHELLGQTGHFQVTGHLGITPEKNATLDLALTRIDPIGTSLHIKVGLKAATQHINVMASLDDQSGYLSTLLGHSHHDALTLSLLGEGPLDHWQGKLDLTWPVIGKTSVDLTMNLANQTTGTLQGEWHPPAGMLPKEIQKHLPTTPMTFTAGVHFASQTQQLDVTALATHQDFLTLTSTLHMNLPAQTLQGSVMASIQQLAPLSEWSGLPLSGDLTLTADLTGAITTPQIVLTLASEHMEIAANQIQGLDLKMNLIPPSGAEPTRNWPAGLEMTANVSTTSVKLSDPPPWLPPLHPQGTLSARFISPQSLSLEQVAIHNGEEILMTAKGVLQLASQRGHFTVQTQIPQLAKFSKTMPWPVQGKADAQVEIEVAESLDHLDFKALLRTDHLDGLPFEAVMLGPAPLMRLHGRLRPGQHLDAPLLELDGRDVQLRGALSWDLKQQTMQTKATLKAPDLAPFSRMAGKKLTGAMEMTAIASGPWSAPQAKMQVVIQGLRVEQQLFQTVTLTADGTDLLRKPAGFLDLVLAQPQGRLALQTRYQVIPPHRIVFDDLKIQGPKTELTGKLQADWQQAQVTGRVTGKIEELAVLEGWLGYHLGGRAELDLALENNQKDTPQGHLQARITNLTGDFGRMKVLNMDGQARLQAGKPMLDAHLEVTHWHQQAHKVDAVKIHAVGPLSDVRITAESRGVIQWPFAIKMQGQMAQTGTVLQVNLNTLNGTLGREPIQLIKPLSMTLGDATLRVEPWELTLGETLLQGEMTRKARRIEARGGLRGDLDLLRRLDIYPIRGATRLDVTVDGDSAHPDVTMTLTLKKGQPLGEDLQHLPPVDLTLTGTMDKGRDLKMDFVAHGFTHGEMKGHAEWPLQLGLFPWVVGLSRTDGLIADVQGDFKLADIGKWLAWDEEQRLEGLLVLNVHTTGTLEHPRLDGTMTLDHGIFEQAEAGTSLQDIQMRVKAMGDHVVLESLTATDGEKGTLKATGRMQLDPERHYPWLMDLQLGRAVLVRRDDAMAELTGNMGVKGTLEEVRIAGELTVNRSEFKLASGGGPEITVLELDEERREAIASSSTEPMGTMRTVLDMVIHLPARLFVRGRGLESEWQGNVHVGGSVQEPHVTGQLKVKRGVLDLLDRKFVLGTGVLILDGSWPPVPTLELEATVQRAAIVTRIGLEGVVTKPKILLTSEPVMSEEEILSHLLFDRATDSITPGQALKLAVALKTLQGGGPDVMGSVKRELGIDRLEVGGDSVETGTVSAGKYLTDDIYLEVEKGLKADSGRINVEVEMMPNLFLKTGVDAKSNGDIGVQWKQDY
ncbi:MAG: translocation/assembly module TamB domain-containing protein [Magnetococcus sp. YQC-5]